MSSACCWNKVQPSGAGAMSAEGDGGRGGARGKQESDHRSQTEPGFRALGVGMAEALPHMRWETMRTFYAETQHESFL